MREDPIVISDTDIARLRGLLGAGRGDTARNAAHLEELRSELDRAQVLEAELVPRDVVGMGSWVRIRDSANGSVEDYQLVFPRDADPATHRLSILAPLGTALLGTSEGDEVEWRMPGGVRRFRVQRVTQGGPPAAAPPHLNLPAPRSADTPSFA
jgi:regulator of nucleoside diphosphate kinase